MNKKTKHIFIILTFILILGTDGCLIIKHKQVEEPQPVIQLSPKPEIPMSEEIVRSRKGDMIAFLPKDWFFVDVEEKASADIFAVAVNPDYTLSAVFSIIRKTDRIDEVVDKEGLLGLARTSFARHEKKTAGTVKQVGNYSSIQLGPLEFVMYEFSTSASSEATRAAVFKSSLNQYYQFALVPMNFNGKPQPDKAEIDVIFNSILATIQY
jgi:hypothetical protein